MKKTDEIRDIAVSLCPTADWGNAKVKLMSIKFERGFVVLRVRWRPKNPKK